MSPQGVDAIALAIPVFFLLIGLEVVFDLRARRSARSPERRRLYRLNDTLNDLSCGTLQQLAGVFGKTFLFAGYVVVFERLALFELEASTPWIWAAAFVGVDFCYYWFHRASHEVNLLWAAHIVHHQSEEYNLSVALRQSIVQQFLSIPFYWPLAVAGVPPTVFLATDAFVTLYQFWIHTRAIGRLGVLDALLNTPSNHRVHHGSNAKYIDRNHAGVLIVWDRMFGTYQREEEEPAYGVTRPLANWNPLWANAQYFAELLAVARRTRRWRDKVAVFLRGPAWRPVDVPFEAVPYSPLDGRKYDSDAPAGLVAYAVAQFAIAMGAVIALLFAEARLAEPARVALALFAVWGLANVGGLYDRRPWLPASEIARWTAAALALVVVAPERFRLAAVVGGLAAAALSGRLVVVHRDAFRPRGGELPVTAR